MYCCEITQYVKVNIVLWYQKQQESSMQHMLAFCLSDASVI